MQITGDSIELTEQQCCDLRINWRPKMAKIICSTTHNANRFGWDRNHGTVIGSAFVSDLDGALCGPLYADAADSGFGLVSNKTGEVAYFALEHDRRDDEGDVQSWEFIVCPETEKAMPQLRGARLTVFND